MKITCLIVDDEPSAVNLLKEYIGQVSFLELTHACYDALEALAYLRTYSVDLLFLDINMPGLSGMELTALLPPQQKIIFTTAYAEYALESYEKNAVDYLLKPIPFRRFLQAVLKLQTNVSEPDITEELAMATDEYFFTKSGKQIVRVEYKNILYVEAWKEYVLLFTTAGKLVLYKRMKELEELLPVAFQRIHHSYIVNSAVIEKIEDNHVCIAEARLPISDKYRLAFMQFIQQKLI
jgi:DNA-binding LytR/AlgR family response regulator